MTPTDIAAALHAELGGGTQGATVNHLDRVRVDHPELPAATGTALAPVWGSTTITVKLDGTGATVEIPQAWLTRERT